MTVLLWGEQLKKTWEGLKKAKPVAFSVALVQNAEEVRGQGRWVALLCPESELAKIPKELFQLGLICPLVQDSTTSGWQKDSLRLPLRFFTEEPLGLLALAAAHGSLLSQKRELDKTVHSLGKTQEFIADSTAQLVQKLEQHIQIAAEIQKSLLPTMLPKIAGVTLFAKFFPSHGLGGDYYDIFEFGDRKRYGFLLADSQTHGMAAALLSALLKIRIEQIREDFTSAGDFIVALGKHIQSEIPVKSADLHLFYGIFDRSSLDFRFASAGDLRPVLFRGGRLMSAETRAEGPLRAHPLTTLPENHWPLEPGDYLVLASKGLENLTSPQTPEAWLDTHLKRQDQWPDPIDIQNEIAALARDPSLLKDDVTMIQLCIEPKALYLKRG